MQNNGFKFRHPRKRKECFDTKGKRVFVLEKYKKALKKWKDEDETHTNEKFAEMVGVDFRTVYRWENGSEVPWQKNIDRIEEVLGTSVSSYEVNIDNCLDDNCTENMPLFLEIINLQYGIKTSRIVSLIRTLSGIEISRSELLDLVDQEYDCNPECNKCKNRNICCESRMESTGQFRCTVCVNKECPTYKLEIKPVCCDGCENRSKCIKQDRMAYVLSNIISVLDRCRKTNEDVDTTVIAEGQYNLSWRDRYALVQLVNPMSKVNFIMREKKIEHESPAYRKLLNNYAKNKDEIQFLFAHFSEKRSLCDALLGELGV